MLFFPCIACREACFLLFFLIFYQAFLGKTDRDEDCLFLFCLCLLLFYFLMAFPIHKQAFSIMEYFPCLPDALNHLLKPANEYWWYLCALPFYFFIIYDLSPLTPLFPLPLNSSISLLLSKSERHFPI